MRAVAFEIIGTISVYCVAFHDLKRLTWPDPLSSLDLQSAPREWERPTYLSTTHGVHLPVPLFCSPPRGGTTSHYDFWWLSLVPLSSSPFWARWCICLQLIRFSSCPLSLQSREKTHLPMTHGGSLLVPLSSNPPWDRKRVCLWPMMFPSCPSLSAMRARETHLPTIRNVLELVSSSSNPPWERDYICLHLMTSSIRLLVLQSSMRQMSAYDAWRPLLVPSFLHSSMSEMYGCLWLRASSTCPFCPPMGCYEIFETRTSVYGCCVHHPTYLTSRMV